MAALTDLKKRLRSVQTICQLAGAMRTVSSAKLARLSAANAAFAPYAEGCRELLVSSGAILSPGEGADRTLVILLSGNRGLCGSYHNDLFAFFRSLAEPEGQDYIACGKMAAGYCREKGIPLLASFPVSDVPRYAEAEALADRILDLYCGGRVGRVLFVYGEGVNACGRSPGSWSCCPGTRKASPATCCGSRTGRPGRPVSRNSASGRRSISFCSGGRRGSRAPPWSPCAPPTTTGKSPLRHWRQPSTGCVRPR